MSENPDDAEVWNITPSLDVDQPRLLVLSSGNRSTRFISSAIKRNVKKAAYCYETSSLDDILATTIAELGGIKVDSIAFMMHGTDTEMYLAGVGNVALSSQSLSQNQNVKEFFLCLSTTFMNTNHMGTRIDFLDCPIKESNVVFKMSQELEKIVNCPVGIAHDLYGTDIKDSYLSNNNYTEAKAICAGELYFYTSKLENLLNSSVQSEIQNLSGYEMVRTVGKGAFGTAVLYRKKEDDSLVIVKKINMHDLTASERQLAINEVSVLSMLNHENIVTYYDSFEEDGVLMIEMEYANGGTLAQYLSQLKAPIEERDILLMFKQIVSAIKHMHDHNILHRDLKTANIFMTEDGIIKVGDFGISKVLTTRQGGALTVVGTPYYISPEMCEGKLYNQKSDIWALGCILYEIACQQKTFEGSNLPALVNKIVKGQFAPVKGNYSVALKQLIRDLLQRDPDFRPTAAEILDLRLPELLNIYEDPLSKDFDDTEISMDFDFQTTTFRGTSKQPLRSVLYDLKMYQADISLIPISLPPRCKIKEVALSSTHMIALTSELLVYTWGDGRKGQLGHGKLETWREKPLCVDALKGKNITRICAGEGFSVFSSDNGIIMTCGDGSYGCLGHGDWNMCIKPKIIEKLLSVDVSAVSCGPQHVVVVGGEGEAYAWGSGAGGRLGTGVEEDCCSPTEVQFANDIRVIRAYCGRDGTMFVTDTSELLVCGHNDNNKLGLNEQRGFLSQMKQFISKTEIEKQVLPIKLSWLRQRVVSVSMGASHTAVLVEPGKIISFGCNKSGQLGRGNQKSHSSPSWVKYMADRTVTMVQCGDTFTLVGTAENAVYFWGSRQVLSSFNTLPYKNGTKRASKESFDSDFVSEISETSVSEIIKIGESNSPLMREIERVGPDSPIIQVKTPDCQLTDSMPSSMKRRQSPTTLPYEAEVRDNLVDSCTGRKDVILQPQEILALYASPAQVAKGEIVKLMNLYCFGMQVYLVVDTTAPLPRCQSRKSKPTENNIQQSIQNVTKYEKDVAKEESLGQTPKWLQKELEVAAAESLKCYNVEKYGNYNDSKLDYQQSNYAKQNTLENRNQDSTLKKEFEKLLQEKNKADLKLKQMEEKFIKSETGSQNKNREKQLEEEIAKLREQLNYQMMHPENYRQLSQNTVSEDDGTDDKRKTLLPKKKSSRSKQFSRICLLQ